jgi:hypothetical protein
VLVKHAIDNLSVSFDIDALPEVGVPLEGVDDFAVYDDSAGAVRKASVARITEFILGSGIGLASQVEAEAGTETEGRVFSPLRVKQAIDALGVTDHGALTGLADDDHPQYHNDARGDARYDSLGSASAVQSNLNAHVGNTSNPHSVTHAQLPDKGSNTHSQIDSHISNSSIHTAIPAKMPEAEAEAGIATTQRTISADVLAAAIEALGAKVSGWTEYTTAWTGTVTNPSVGNGILRGRWRRIGDMAEYEIYMVAGNTTTFGSGNWRFSLDTGNSHALDTSKLLRLNVGGANVFGMAHLYDNSLTTLEIASVVQFGASTTLVGIYAGTELVDSLFPFTWFDVDYLFMRFSVPISGWSA